MKNLGAEWSKPTEEELWTIRVRWKYGLSMVDETIAEGECVPPDLMKMQIQLFQLEPNNYLVDFKFDGWESSTGTQPARQDVDEMSSFSAYPFLHLATRLIMELASIPRRLNVDISHIPLPKSRQPLGTHVMRLVCTQNKTSLDMGR